ncbi:hypothetical protein ACOME3_004098 [Neoechinorhynchus agilis]
MKSIHELLRSSPIYIDAMFRLEDRSIIIDEVNDLIKMLRIKFDRIDVITKRQRGILYIGHCCASLSYNLLCIGRAAEGASFGLDAIELYEKVNANAEVLRLIPYLAILGCLVVEDIDKYSRLVDIYEHFIDELADDKTAFNWLYILKLELAEETGFLLETSISRNTILPTEGLMQPRNSREKCEEIHKKIRLRLSRHTHHMGSRDHLSKLYGHCLVSQSYARSKEYRKAVLEFSQAIRSIYAILSAKTEDGSLSVRSGSKLNFCDPLFERALLKLSECQILVGGEIIPENCWILDACHEAIKSHGSGNRSILLFYQAIIARLGGEDIDSESLVKESMNTSKELGQKFINNWVEFNWTKKSAIVEERTFFEWSGVGRIKRPEYFVIPALKCRKPLCLRTENEDRSVYF